MAGPEKDTGLPRTIEQRPQGHRGERGSMRWVRLIALAIGALVFIFPFYYMVVSALQKTPNPDLSGAFPNPSSLSFDNFVAIDRAISLGRTLLNSGLFTGGVLLGTLVFGARRRCRHPDR